MRQLGIIGGGNMARSILTGLLKQGVDPRSIGVSDPHAAACNALQQTFGVQVTTNNLELLCESEVVLLAVKPQTMRQVCEEVGSHTKSWQLILSIAAGIPTSFLQRYFNNPIIRAMPNTPALIQQGITALYALETVALPLREKASQLLSACGQVLWLEQESQLDIVTAISGSGPAYFFALQEALIAAAIDLGLTASMALSLVKQTAIGAALLVEQTQEAPGELRQKVTSKGGTTEKALEVLTAGNWHGLIKNAVAAASQRAKELSEEQ